MILKNLDTKNKDKCVLLSHIFISSGQHYKHEVIRYVTQHYTDRGYYVILTGHSDINEIPEGKTLEFIDYLYWESNIDRSQLGKGHPRFVINGLEAALSKGFSKILKMRAEDILLFPYEKLLESLGSKKCIISEQTSLYLNRIGDLFHFGDTKYILDWWKEKEWDYNKDGLFNLFKNAEIAANNLGIPLQKYTQENLEFLSPFEIMWYCISDCWDHDLKMPINLESNYWGRKQGYTYHGGLLD
jgi:hypothetical protein